MTTIKHNRYNGAGEIIDTFEVEVKPSNETATDIYITEEFLHSLAKRMGKGTSSKSPYDAYEKAVWYKPEEGEPVRVKRMDCKRQEKNCEITFTRLDDKKITKILNV